TPTATLLAGWVETQVLASQPDPAAALDRLTPEAARQADEAARAVLSAEALAGAAWRPDRLAAAANAAGEQNQALAAALQEVRRLMTLAGVAGCEDGRLAREVALRLPIGITVGSTGDLFVASHMSAGVGRLDPRDGRMYYVLGPCKDQALTVPPFDKLVAGPSGWIYASSLAGRGVFRFRAGDPRPERWAGGGEEVPRLGLAATSCKFDEVKAVAVAADGQVHFIATIRAINNTVDHLVTTDAKGTLTALEERAAHGVALAATEDGALWLLENGGVLFRRAPGGTMVPTLAARLFNVDIRFTNMLAMPDNSVLVSLSREDAGTLWQGVKRVAPGATAPEPFLGSGELGYDEGPVARLQARLSRPAGLARDGRGRVLVADYGNGVIRSYDPATGLLETVAGRREDKDVVAADAVLDLPAGICYDATGHLVVTEVGSNTVRQLQAGRLRRIAGGLGGFAADGAIADRLTGPLLVARGTGGLLLVENRDHLVRALLPGAVPGTLTLRTVAGGSRNLHSPSALPLRATDANWTDLTALTTDAAGRPVFAATLAGTKTGCVWRVEPDGALTKLAGVPLGDAKALVLSQPSDREGQPASAVGLGFVTGLAYDAAGRLCFSEVDHGLVWRVEPDGTLHRLAGRGQGDTLVFLAEPDAEARARAEGDMPGQDAVLLSPIGLAADAKGNVYVAEAGTRGLGLFKELLHLAALPLDLTQLAQLDGRVRRLAPDGTAHTLAGLGGPPGTEDIRNPIALALSPEGQLALVDLGAGQVKLLTNP
ncbi:MAG: hypothetical protein VKS61_11350, partial [Candidatus Sericytochromatia bacterium]|nr:hypothetical protein [Candidatus Sericytochromatia bacterium]